MSPFIVYALCEPSGVVRYVGKSSSGLRRPRQHWRPGNLCRDPNLRKRRWIEGLLRSGQEPKVLVLRELVSSAGLDDAERDAIREHRCPRLLNLTDGGDGLSGWHHSLNSRARMSAAKLGRPLSVGHRARLSAARAGNTNKRGKVESMDTRVRKSLARGGRPFQDDSGRMYQTQREASRALGIPQGSISQVLRSKCSTAGGRRFSYVEGT